MESPDTGSKDTPQQIYASPEIRDAIKAQDLEQANAIFDGRPELLNSWVLAASDSHELPYATQGFDLPLLYYAATIYHRTWREEVGVSVLMPANAGPVPADSVAIVRAMVDRGAHLSRTPLSKSAHSQMPWMFCSLWSAVQEQDSVAMLEQLMRAGAVRGHYDLDTALKERLPRSFAFLFDGWRKDADTSDEDVELLVKMVVASGSSVMFEVVDERGLVPHAPSDDRDRLLLNRLLVAAARGIIGAYRQQPDREAVYNTLLSYGAEARAHAEPSNSKGYSFLYWLCQWASAELLQPLICGQDPATRMMPEPYRFSCMLRTENTPIVEPAELGGYLHHAALVCHVPGVDVLLQNGAWLGVTAQGRTPIHWISLRGHTSLFEDKCDNVSDASKRFADAARQIITKLVAAGATLDAQDEHGCTALHYACRLKMNDLIPVLVDLGASTDLCDNNGLAPIHHLGHELGEFLFNECTAQILSDKTWYTESFANTIKTCFSTDQLNMGDAQLGLTPLMYATRYYNPRRMQWLLDMGADPNIRDNSGQTALHHAMVRPVRFHVPKGKFATPSLWGQGDARREEVVNILTSAGADATITDAGGRSAEDVRVQEELWIGPRREDEAMVRREREEAIERSERSRFRFGGGGRGRGSGRGRYGFSARLQE
ncbi:hypothetical protein PWT90_09105 [Aphanocladium album]|nr:hypothetical protein PWT90_09105 [Aphanocladium album]